jgi:hypothetical protein
MFDLPVSRVPGRLDGQVGGDRPDLSDECSGGAVLAPAVRSSYWRRARRRREARLGIARFSCPLPPTATAVERTMRAR